MATARSISITNLTKSEFNNFFPKDVMSAFGIQTVEDMIRINGGDMSLEKAITIYNPTIAS